MNAEKASYRPIKFLDRMEGNNHIVLLYNNQKYADLVMTHYFLNGLQKGESCIFFTADNPETIEERLSAEGIDVNSYNGQTYCVSFTLKDTVQINLMCLAHSKV